MFLWSLIVLSYNFLLFWNIIFLSFSLLSELYICEVKWGSIWERDGTIQDTHRYRQTIITTHSKCPSSEIHNYCSVEDGGVTIVFLLLFLLLRLFPVPTRTRCTNHVQYTVWPKVCGHPGPHPSLFSKNCRLL